MQIKYVVKTKRLGMRGWKEADIPQYHELSSDPVVMKFFPEAYWLDLSKAEAAVLNYNEHLHSHGFTYFAVDLLESGEFIGFIGMKHINYDIHFAPAIDIGWRLAKKYWGRGLATEGALAVQNWFFTSFHYEKLVSMTPIQNVGSEKVMKKIGMKKVEDFAHPLLSEDDQLSIHLLYESER